ncbi:MAG: TetR/AcrR family transcriptional regulator [Anaerolineales bacterium]|nr:TetR/AcrR family transcriptional regulator [Anaerolineales bacterium]
MNDGKQDRRSRRTRETLIHALLELIERKHYDQISVQDIVEQANVGRSTFYAHYGNKDDLLLSGLEHQMELLVGQITLGGTGRLDFDTRAFFQHTRGHYEIYRTLVWGAGFKLLVEDGQAMLSAKIEARLAALLAGRPEPSIPLPVLANAIAGVLLVLLKWWLDNKSPYPPERMDAIFQQLVMGGVRSALP